MSRAGQAIKGPIDRLSAGKSSGPSPADEGRDERLPDAPFRETQYGMRYKDVEVSGRPEIFNANNSARNVHAKIACEPVQLGDSGFRDVSRDHLMIKMGQIESIAPSRSRRFRG
ncbi:hypothetical protein Q2941_11350 [Bradyrhizobium sp. UFLA05-153]